MTDGARKKNGRKRSKDLMPELRRRIPGQFVACRDHERVAETFCVHAPDVVAETARFAASEVYVLRRAIADLDAKIASFFSLRDGFGRPMARETRPAEEPRRAA